MSHRIAKAFNRSQTTRAVALDIFKASNRVWHAGLLHKHKSHEISGQIIGLISSFFGYRWLWVLFSGNSAYEYLVNAGVSQGSIVGPTLHLLYINDLLDHVICEIAICADDTLYCKFYQAFLISGKNFNWLLNLNLIYMTMWTGVRSGLFISMLDRKTELVSFNQSNNTGSIDVKMDGSVLEENSSFKMLWLTFSSKLDWGSYIISIAKTAYKKIGTLTRSMRFLSPEVVLYLYKRSLYLFVLLCIFKPLVHHGNMASLTLFYRYYFGRCSSELAILVPFSFFSREVYSLF